ncbi:hypothetical protein EON63_01395 [archaeon]|nr:MAG: hypothetical protein EON63_01395 [archaeon]
MQHTPHGLHPALVSNTSQPHPTHPNSPHRCMHDCNEYDSSLVSAVAVGGVGGTDVRRGTHELC